MNINVINIISFIILLCLGIYKIFEYSIKKYFKELKEKEFNLFNIKFILNVVTNNTLADIDNSKILSVKESISLGVALSLDGICAALTVGLTFNNYFLIFILSFSITFFMFLAGNIIGKKTSTKNLNLNWLSGVILIILAITKII